MALSATQNHAVAMLNQMEDKMDQVEIEINDDQLLDMNFATMTWDQATTNLKVLTEAIMRSTQLSRTLEKLKPNCKRPWEGQTQAKHKLLL
jgi:hypothetical protein